MNKSLATQCIHETMERDLDTGSIVPNICLSSTFYQEIPGIPLGIENKNSFGKGFEYSRTGNPTRGKFERCAANLEGCEYGIAFSSGSSTIDAVISLLNRGDKVVSIDDVYGGTNRYMRKIGIEKLGLSIDFCDLTKDNLVLDETISMIWLETPTNPLLKIVDIKKIAEKKDEKTILVVDNTFASPCFQNPISFGADIVIHSGTKYLGGHSDLTIGIACTNSKNYFDRLRFLQNSKGAVPSPFDCYQVMRGIKTLFLRMREHEYNALKIAKYLELHDSVKKVIYPGLESHDDHLIAKKQMRGFGGMISFIIDGDVLKFLKKLKYFTLAESLGAVESLVEVPSLMTHAAISNEERLKLGLDDNLIRLSVGIENVDDLINDLKEALKN